MSLCDVLFFFESTSSQPISSLSIVFKSSDSRLPLKKGDWPNFWVIQEKPAFGIIFVSFSILPSFNVIFKVINQFLKNMRWTHCEQYDMWRRCIHFFNYQKLFLHLKKQLDHISVPNACYMKWCLSTSFTSLVTKQSLSTWEAYDNHSFHLHILLSCVSYKVA